MKKKLGISKTKILGFFDKRSLGSIPRVFLSSLLIIFFFYSMPLFINFKKNKNLEFQNNSKAVLAYTLSNESTNKDAKNQKNKVAMGRICSRNDITHGRGI